MCPRLKVTKEFSYVSAEKVYWKYGWMELWWRAESEFYSAH